MPTRRDFVRHAALTAVGLNARPFWFASVGTDSKSWSLESPFIAVEMADNQPQFRSLSLDSLGAGKRSPNALIPNATPVGGQYTSVGNSSGISYWLKEESETGLPVWTVRWQEAIGTLTSRYSAKADPVVLTINQSLNHATVLGVMPRAKRINLPCLIHLPGQGTIRVSSPQPDGYLTVDARRFSTPAFVEIGFPTATVDQPQRTYQLDITAIFPTLKGVEKNPLYDGFRRNFINIFQMNPRLRVLANNSSSDPCAFTLYEYAEVAKVCPPLAPGLTAMDLVRNTLDRYLSGMKAYGIVGFPDKYEGADTISWKSPFDTMDSYPSLLLSACYYVIETKDLNWGRTHSETLLGWGQRLLDQDKGNTGLLKHGESGNSGSWVGSPSQRPANWWDTIGFGHEDAYANALAYRAFTQFAMVLRQLGRPAESLRYAQKAAQLKSVYYRTFYNPATGMLAGWRSADGKLHDYAFTFISGVAVTYGLVEGEQARKLMQTLLAKCHEVGYTNFALGLPGNLIPIRRADYTHLEKRWGGPEREDGTDAFQIYENGGATACFAYFTIQALLQVGMRQEATRILTPMLQSFTDGSFEGKAANGMTYDWKNWQGEPHGYEGFLVDNYLTLLAVVNMHS